MKTFFCSQRFAFRFDFVCGDQNVFCQSDWHAFYKRQLKGLGKAAVCCMMTKLLGKHLSEIEHLLLC